MSGRRTLSPSGPMSYLPGLALRILTSFWRREGSAGMDMWNAPLVQSRQPSTYRLRKSVGLGGPRWHGSSWQRGIAESGSSRLSTLMIDIPGDLVWDLPCLQQASYLEGGPLMWRLPCTCMLIQNTIVMIWWWWSTFQTPTYIDIIARAHSSLKQLEIGMPFQIHFFPPFKVQRMVWLGSPLLWELGTNFPYHRSCWMNVIRHVTSKEFWRIWPLLASENWINNSYLG